MMDIKSQTNNNIMEAIVHGKITGEDMDKVEVLLKEMTLEEEPINLLLVMQDMEGITLNGLLEDMKLAKYLRSIKKVAIVGDKTWLKVDAKIEGLYPGIDMKSFEMNEKKAATNWLEG